MRTATAALINLLLSFRTVEHRVAVPAPFCKTQSHWTIWVKVGEILGAHMGVTWYETVIECLPVDNVLSVRLALPPFSSFAPMIVAPSLNVTHPVGALELDDVTTARKVTACPKADGLVLVLSTVEVRYLLTCCRDCSLGSSAVAAAAW